MEELFAAGGFEALLAMLLGMLIIGFVLSIGVYIYLGFAFMALGRKANVKTPELAWIPFGIGPLIIAYQTSKMHWWPWLLLIGLIIPYLNYIISIVFTVYAFIWLWKLFEKIGRPGWWVLFNLIPGIGNLVFLILAGVAAWAKK